MQHHRRDSVNTENPDELYAFCEEIRPVQGTYRREWDVDMRNYRIAVALLAAFAVVAPSVEAQTAQKPTPYTGVSQPPPDDTITTDDATQAAPGAKLVARPAAAPAVPAAAPVVRAPAPATPAALPSNCNPDDRMIGDPSPCEAPTAELAAPKPANDLDADIVTSVPTRPGELPEGTTIRMSLNEELSSGESQVGSDFSGKVAADVLSSGKVVIPQGSEVLGKVVRVTEGRRFGTPATIRVRPDVVVLPDGSRYVLRAQLVATDSKARVDDEGTLKPASQVKKNVIEEGAGIGTGAVAGALVGGGPGALVGSLIGAGVMTTHILVQHPAPVRVAKDSILTLSLTQPMLITPEVASN